MVKLDDFKLILIHGRDQQFTEPVGQAEEWTRQLRWGLEHAAAPYARDDALSLGRMIDYAHYGDIEREDRLVLQSTFDLSDAEEEIERIEASLLADMITALGGDPAVPQSDLGYDVLAFMVQRLDAYLHIGEGALRLFIQDLSRYFRLPGRREEVLERVSTKVETSCKQGIGKVILLAHSMGTVVCYDLLRERPELPIYGFISFGSILGYPTVRRYVRNPNGDTPFPQQLKKWSNIYNKKDFATFVRELAPLYRPEDRNDLRRVDDREAQGREPSPLSPMAAHDPKVYLSSTAFGAALKRMLEES